ncbi:MAG TPA: hypothetical protein VN364_00195 [Bellilinea sp.]|nr:hypothetical protein [Bellilinea sp.]
MQTKYRISGYDFIKLAFTLAVAVFLYVAFRSPSQPQPVADLSLPAYPQADFEWEYDPETRELLNPQGIQLYRLDADNVTWRPIIPATLSLQLPGEHRVVQNSQRTWQILDAVGAVVSSWDAANFRWVMGIIPTATQPRPTPTLQITATPPAPSPTPTSVPPTATLTASVTQSALPACNTDVQTYLTAGQPAQVLINLNMHNTPEMTDNVFDANPAGVVVDVLQGPVCVPYLTGAYWWWEIRNAEGVTGWSVEATINGAVYFLGPME